MEKTNSNPAVVLKKKSMAQGTKVIQAAQAIPMHQKKYHSIIFDLAGVLISWQPAVTAEQLYPHTQAATIIQTLVKDPYWLEFDRGNITICDLANYAAERHNFDLILTTQIVATIANHLPPFSTMIKALLAAKTQGYKIYILSNMPGPFYKELLHNYDFFNHCDGIVASYQIKFIKPELEIYQYLLEKFNIDPRTALFIDDVEENIVAGNSLGIDGIVCKKDVEVINLLEQNNILKPE
jgi:HAD superfamily hydrolase (TIGR01509 family)